MIKHINLLIKVAAVVFLILLLITATVKMRDNSMPNKVIKAYVTEPNLKAELSEKKAIIIALTERNKVLTKDIEKRTADILELQKKLIDKEEERQQAMIQEELKIIYTNIQTSQELKFAKGIHKSGKTIKTDTFFTSETTDLFTPAYRYHFYINSEDINIGLDGNNVKILLSRSQIKLSPLAYTNETDSIKKVSDNKIFPSHLRYEDFVRLLEVTRLESRHLLEIGDIMCTEKEYTTVKEFREDAAIEFVNEFVGKFGYDNVIVEFID